MQKAIVVGANGFLGSHLVKKLLDDNIEVIAIVRDETSDLSRLPQNECLTIKYCNAANISKLTEIITDKDIYCMYYLAWDGSTGKARGDWALQFANAKYTTDAAQTAFDLGCKRFVGTGTLAEKDCNAYIPLAGSCPDAVSCYGSAKIAAHYMSKAVCAKNGLAHIWIYVPNTYGPGNRTQNFVNFASKTMLDGKRAAFTNGDQLYEFVYVSDTVAGISTAASKGIPFCSYYIGGKPRLLKEYIINIRDAIDKNIPLYLGEIPFNGVAQPREAFDSSGLKSDTGFSVSVPFELGIVQTIAWIKVEKQWGG